MATEIPPLDNSFCNYVDDTLGGHFEMNAFAQRTVGDGAATRTSITVLGDWARAWKSGELIQLTGDK